MAESMRDLNSRLHAAVRAVCPNDGIRVPLWRDKSTWSVEAPSATPEQRAAAQKIIDDFVFDPSAIKA